MKKRKRREESIEDKEDDAGIPELVLPGDMHYHKKSKIVELSGMLVEEDTEEKK